MEFLRYINWSLILEITYLVITVLTCIRVVIDTNSVQKTMSYLLLVIFIPIIGAILYFSIGINYRKRKIYIKKLRIDEKRANEFISNIRDSNKQFILEAEKKHPSASQLLKLLSNPFVSNQPIFNHCDAQIICNGENLFKDVLQEIKNAKQHIHLEYYIFENDEIGNQLKDALIEKARQGVEVRLIYDDFGSSGISHNIVKELNLQENAEAFAFHEIKILFLANRLNYRNHRKIIIIDGIIAYTGGINISDKYINSETTSSYWRDIHIKIRGSAVLGLQHTFLSDWNFCSGQTIGIGSKYFPENAFDMVGNSSIQIVASGPDSDIPVILFAYLQAINSAQNEILLTTPYYIPDNTLQQALILAALRGVSVKLLVPKNSDFKIVRWASQAYYDELLKAGVQIYLYSKGFIHAKTMVIDGQICSVGTANLDSRSFDLNFEVTAIVYDENVSMNLKEEFEKDILDSELIIYSRWRKRNAVGKFIDKLIRLLSPLL